ncbi:MAG: hypothetical protein J3K34DRAFT_406488, partial [Monoraphidium minutum]
MRGQGSAARRGAAAQEQPLLGRTLPPSVGARLPPRPRGARGARISRRPTTLLPRRAAGRRRSGACPARARARAPAGSGGRSSSARPRGTSHRGAVPHLPQTPPFIEYRWLCLCPPAAGWRPGPARPRSARPIHAPPAAGPVTDSDSAETRTGAARKGRGGRRAGAAAARAPRPCFF